jgi:hypothetical protein
MALHLKWSDLSVVWRSVFYWRLVVAEENEGTFNPMLPEEIFKSLENAPVTTFGSPTHCFPNENSLLESNTLGRVTDLIASIWVLNLCGGVFG